jgi:O-antigen/teichoic acid export membrane protein
MKQPTGTEFIASEPETSPGWSRRLRQMLTSDSLKARCAKGTVSLTAGTAVSKAVSLVSKIILAKLLLAEERGLMIVILPLVTFFETLTEIGIKQSVIQHKEGASEDYLNMAWWIQSIRGVVLYGAAFLIAPVLCRLWVYDKVDASLGYSRVELLWMVRIAFLTILFNGLISPRSNVLLKQFRFGRSVVLVQGSAIVSSVLTIVLAVMLRSVWAFVIGTVSQYLVLCVLSYLMCPFRPRASYDAKSFHALVQFSRGMLGLPILTYLAFNMDILIGSFYVSSSVIGMYGFALILARTPREILTRIFGPLLIPAYAEKQDDPEAIGRGVVWITRATSLIVLPLTVYLVLCRDALLTIFYKPEFTDIAMPFVLLVLTYTILLQEFPLGKVFFGMGVPGKHRMYVIIRAALFGALIVPAARMYGMTGVASMLLLSNVIAFFYQLWTLRQLIGLEIGAYFNAWVPGLAASAVYAAGVSVMFWLWPQNLAVQFWMGGVLLGLVLAVLGGVSFMKPRLLFQAQST